MHAATELSSPLHAALAERSEWSDGALTQAAVDTLIERVCRELESPPLSVERVMTNPNTAIYRVPWDEGYAAIKIALRKSPALIDLEYERLVELAAIDREVPTPILKLEDSPAYVLRWVDSKPVSDKEYEQAMVELAQLPWTQSEAQPLLPLAESTMAALRETPLSGAVRKIVKTACEFLASASSPIACCHGDLHRDNILIATDGTTTILDPRPRISTMPLDWDLATCLVSYRLTLKGLPRSTRPFTPPDNDAGRSAVLAALQILRLAELQTLWSQDAEITGSRAAQGRARLGDVVVRLAGRKLQQGLVSP